MLKKIFVTSPLSSGMTEKIASYDSAPLEQITLGFLKNLGIISTIKVLRSVQEMTVVLEDTESESLMDLFCLLFIFTKSKKIDFIKEDLSRFSLGRKEIIFVLIKNLYSLALGFYCSIKVFFLSKKIILSKNNAKINNVKDIMYLKTNYWFGVKAGGSVAHVEGVIGGLEKHNYHIDYVAIDCPTSLKSFIKNYFSLPLPKFLSPIFSLNLYVFDNLTYKFFKKKDFKKYGFIYHRMALNSIAGALLARRLKIPLILEYNGSEVWVQRNWGKPLFLERISQSIENAMLSYASYIVTISDVLKQELIGRGFSEEKIICYPNCVDPKKFNSELYTQKDLIKQREKLGFSKDDIVLTFVGTFGKWHGVEVLARTICQLFKEEAKWLKDKKVKFMLVGDGACMADVKNILSTIPDYPNFVRLTGLVKQEETPIYLALSDILLSPHCSPNRNEQFFGSPTKLFEYMAMKKIIIASNLGQIGEVLSPSIHVDDINKINDTFLSLLCNQGDIEGLVKAIKYAIDNLPELCFMGRNARDKVLKFYTWEKHVNEILKFVRKI